MTPTHIAVTGQVASGKTVLAERLSAVTGIPRFGIDNVAGDWAAFARLARRRSPLIVESIVLPRWPLTLHVHCRCDEPERQRRLAGRPGYQQGPPPARYDHSAVADVVVDTTGPLELGPVLDRIHVYA